MMRSPLPIIPQLQIAAWGNPWLAGYLMWLAFWADLLMPGE